MGHGVGLGSNFSDPSGYGTGHGFYNTRPIYVDINDKFDKYWDNCHIMMGVATVVDPRYKMKLVEFYFSLIYDEISQSKIDEVRQNCCDLLVYYQSKTKKSLENSGGSGIDGTSSVSNIDASDINILDMYDKFVASSSSQAASKSLTELDMYLEEIVLPRTQHFDILSWWKTNEVKYPNLQKMTKDVLDIHVSTVASESTFAIVEE
ncbi:zinc finger BED domain-containing protein DAYSLEEPER-like [Primulina huaijiensis]|uniref:zinc finger BED domain-containing protein DAYSLEEPER-like n=1 Tax=Primulina huaijiensis TaxID=1492673 RepID=UPI003CC770AF